MIYYRIYVTNSKVIKIKKVLAFFFKVLYTMICLVLIYLRCQEYVCVAQLDRASDYGSEGREFESSRAR